MVAALVLGASAERRASSSLALSTNNKIAFEFLQGCEKRFISFCFRADLSNQNRNLRRKTKMEKMKIIVFAVAVFAAALFFGNVKTVRAQSMEWSGTVDDVVQVRIRNRNARAITVSGRAYYDENSNFNGRAPRDNANVSVDKRDGRGKVYIVQQPNRRNNFTTIVEIVDKKGGPDRYRFTLNWN